MTDKFTPTRHLPARPWLRRHTPVLWRDERTLEVGEADRRLFLIDVPRDVLNWARTLRGERTLTECLVSCPDPVAGRHLLEALVAAGALDDAATAPTVTSDRPRALRDRDMRHAAAARQVYSDDRADALVDVRAAARIGVHGQGPLAQAVTIALRQAGIGVVSRSAPPSSAARAGRALAADVDLHVLAHGWHPDSFDDAGCLALDLPHLPVAAWGARGVIGPLIVPGRTACLTCGVLHARDRDRAWPALHLQRAHLSVDLVAADSALIAAVAGHSVLTVCAWLDSVALARRGGPSPELECQRVTIRSPWGSVERESFPAHPLCGCRWSRRARDVAVSGR
jgi:hypothetical protein